MVAALTSGIPFWNLGDKFTKDFRTEYPEISPYNADRKLQNFRKAYIGMRWAYWQIDRTRAGLSISVDNKVKTVSDPAEISGLDAQADKAHQAYDRALSRYTGKKVKTDRPEPYLGE